MAETGDARAAEVDMAEAAEETDPELETMEAATSPARGGRAADPATVET